MTVRTWDGERYYREELRFLRELGGELARARPELARFLGAEARDPDVERLLEGTAFLTARLRQRLDEDCPDLVADLLDTLWPQHLLPTPAMAMAQVEAPPQAVEAATLPRGSIIESRPIDGSRCRFATTCELRVAPLTVVACDWLEHGRLRLRLATPRGGDCRRLAGPSLRLHLGDDGADARWLRWRLLAHCRGVGVRSGDREALLPLGALRAAGFADDEALLPEARLSPRRLRLMHEFAAFPDKFLAVDLVGLDRIDALAGAAEFNLLFDLGRLEDPPRTPRLILNRVPLVNVFPIEGEPLRREGQVRAVGDPRHHEVFRVASVCGREPGGAQARSFVPIHLRRACDAGAPAYRLRRWARPDGDGTEVSLAVDASETREHEILSLDLLCTNRRLAMRLGAGDLCVPGTGAPPAIRVRNLAPPTAPVAPPPREDLQARLHRHLALGDPGDADGGLRALIELCDPRAAGSGLASAIERVVARPATRLFDGAPVRGRETEVRVVDGAFAREAELHLLGSMLDEVVSAGAGLNRFSRLAIAQGVAARGAMALAFPARIGGVALA